MKKYIIFLFLLLFWEGELNAQQNIIDSNTKLLNNLEVRYKSPCTSYKSRKVKRKIIRIDKKTIDNLNDIYKVHVEFEELVSVLKIMGYKESSKVKVQDNLVFLYTTISEGNLNGYIEVIYNPHERKISSKKIILGTKKGFLCETKELWSNSSIDFIYLRKFVKRIKIPLQIAWSNAELESK